MLEWACCLKASQSDEEPPCFLREIKHGIILYFEMF